MTQRPKSATASSRRSDALRSFVLSALRSADIASSVASSSIRMSLLPSALVACAAALPHFPSLCAARVPRTWRSSYLPSNIVKYVRGASQMVSIIRVKCNGK